MKGLLRSMRLFFICLLAIFSIDSDEIFWSNSIKLSPRDFKDNGTIDSVSAAYSFTRIKIDYSLTALEEYRVEVFAIFIPDSSRWNTDTSNFIVLLHEQLHFDITELYCRKIRKELTESHFRKSLFPVEVRLLALNYYKKSCGFQDLYDSETDHSKDLKVQLRWQNAIEDSLSKYDGFQNPEVFVNTSP